MMKLILTVWLLETVIGLTVFITILGPTALRLRVLLGYFVFLLIMSVAQGWLIFRSRRQFLGLRLESYLYLLGMLGVLLTQGVCLIFGVHGLIVNAGNDAERIASLMTVHRVGMSSVLGLLFASLLWWDAKTATKD